ncbi:hypothetical protein INR49_031131 [Caranx melampygus]|nr:hypothetical protein INR49_031131 [Caranx melampygus]
MRPPPLEVRKLRGLSHSGPVAELPTVLLINILWASHQLFPSLNTPHLPLASPPLHMAGLIHWATMPAWLKESSQLNTVRGGGRLMMKSYIICPACCSFAQVWTVRRETVSCACGQTRRDL